ncbi:MAG: PQQ-binding-like beta-propeller repeat protein [Blastocatellia bacterium]
MNGPRGTPTVDGDRIYAMAADGTLACLDATTGKMTWSQNVVDKYGGSVNRWGMSESPLVGGNRLVVLPGAPGASVVSLRQVPNAYAWSFTVFRLQAATLLTRTFGGRAC